MGRVMRKHVKGHERRFYRATRPPRIKILTFQEKIIAAKSGNILPHFKVNLCDYQTLLLKPKYAKSLKGVCTIHMMGAEKMHFVSNIWPLGFMFENSSP